MNKTGLLIGYGSIGRHHAAALANSTTELFIVDTNPDSRERAIAAHPEATVFDSLSALEAHGVDWEAITAVIATWGPSHADLFHALADRGVRRIICEKPLASSIRLAREMEQRARNDGITLAVNHYVRTSGFADALARFAEAHELGEPVSVQVLGGAACLVTNGIHWVDFASQIFGHPPLSVIATATGQRINPRSPDLDLYAGTATWSFSEGREATCSFSNSSSLALRVYVLYRNALAEFDADMNALIRFRDREAVERFPKVTRTGPPVELMFEGQLPGVTPHEERMRKLVTDVQNGDNSLAPPEVGADAVGACIGALIASRAGRSVELPIDAGSELAGELWPIS